MKQFQPQPQITKINIKLTTRINTLVNCLQLYIRHGRMPCILSLLCYQQGLFTVLCIHIVCSDTSDGPSQSLDTMKKTDDDDEENCYNSCQSHNDDHLPMIISMFIIGVSSFNSFIRHHVWDCNCFLGDTGTC